MRREDYGLDAREVREYFQYDKVRDGIFGGSTQDLFGVESNPGKPRPGTTRWRPLKQKKKKRHAHWPFYMDNHPRENKYQHAAHWTLRTGVTGRQVRSQPWRRTFPKGSWSTAMETFLHEFGHLLHNLFRQLEMVCRGRHEYGR